MEKDEDQVNISFRLLESAPSMAIVTAKGYIQSPEALHLRETLEHVEAKKVKRVVLDMSSVPYISSSGIGVIVGYCKSKNECEGCGAVAVIGLARSVQNVMHTLGLSSLIPQFENVLSAINAMGIEVDSNHIGQICED